MNGKQKAGLQEKDEPVNVAPPSPPLSPPPQRTSPAILRLFVRRRFIIILTLAIALVAFYIWLPPQTRSVLIAGLLAQRRVLGLLLFFSLVTLSLLWSAGQRLDAQVFLFFNRHRLRTPGLDRLMWLVTQLGGGIYGIALAGLLFALSLRRLGIAMILGTLTLWLFVELVKALADRSRPFISLAEIQVVGRKAIGRSFPSGHTSQAFFLASLLIHFFDLGLLSYLVLYGLAALVGFSRIYIGVHYPRDVLAGAVLGAVWGIMMVLLDPYLAWPLR